MITAPYQEALDAYTNNAGEFSVEPVKGGLINQSYKISSKLTGRSFLLQQINKNIFPVPAIVQSNYEKIWDHLSEEGRNFLLPEPKCFPGGSLLFGDSNEQYWRIFSFIDGKNMTAPVNALQARVVANTFANFTSSFSDFDATALALTIPGFHDLSSRYDQFEHSIHNHQFERLQKASAVIEGLRRREKYVNLYEVFTESNEFLKRVMHHDAKISNVLFDEAGEIICLVDFDTCMPGYFFSDIGDMIRSMAVPADEDSSDISAIDIRKDIYDAILAGYLETMNDQLTVSEKKYIHYSGILMIYMQALRFITDYLNSDTYYRTAYPEQNLDRAKNQLLLLQRLEEFLTTNYSFKT